MGFRQFVLESLWSANAEWQLDTGIENDATRLTKEDFISTAVSGDVLSIGIPVRAPTSELESFECFRGGVWDSYPWSGPYGMFPADVALQPVEIRLDEILIQVLEPGEFQEYLANREWSSASQQAFSPMHYDRNTERYACNAAHFGQLGDQLIVTVGNYGCDDESLQEIRPATLIGARDPMLHEADPTRFLPSGLGTKADEAASILLGRTFGELAHLELGTWKDNQNDSMAFRRPDRTPVYFRNLMLVAIQGFDESWEDWHVFAFAG